MKKQAKGLLGIDKLKTSQQEQETIYKNACRENATGLYNIGARLEMRKV